MTTESSATASPEKSNDVGVPRAEFEAALMRQEHRLFRIILNYWNRKQFAESDPRYQAVTEALVWRIALAFTPTAAIGGCGLVALAGLWFAWQANSLIRDQNRLIELESAQTVAIETNPFFIFAFKNDRQLNSQLLVTNRGNAVRNVIVTCTPFVQSKRTVDGIPKRCELQNRQFTARGHEGSVNVQIDKALHDGFESYFLNLGDDAVSQDPLPDRTDIGAWVHMEMACPWTAKLFVEIEYYDRRSHKKTERFVLDYPVDNPTPVDAPPTFDCVQEWWIDHGKVRPVDINDRLLECLTVQR